MASNGSVAPKERINISYKSNTGGASEDVELPLKMLIVDDFTGRESDEVIEDREPVNINKDNFNDVIKSHNLSMSFSVPNKLKDEGDDINVDLKVDSLAGFGPAKIAEQVPELASLMELRRALQALKGPLGNVPAFRKTIQAILENEETRSQIMKELGLDKE
ncbi:MAG: type VI secretion system contractile sheath small subunit [Oceanospirillaceae bacterium]|uniref:type VI secretion system contractile sheath small subunit n=1 Tax=unclassified Thalassolituus TaxID=2624967 RepID=UPI000C097DD4|nr:MULTISPECIES: type VI secretion system contractile sheath small subunit [unclassified Thalassolituus]MAK90635.1 type VI secretion system contractile sheath small subunit [Thalassolituus sp.]MAS26224.1 type VI secretion system contractile sheath small subunit [Oceanospirillaceae bacterium]MAY01231.1 type VI secretion system contractile sheath small subunit [Oceanospirillaceae bacterium]MBL36398.1 type VI secretion system contractile sheath small subunit [Oceanospirillaceae bacterium]MBS52545|tara:strand:+ start:75 stop:560 length:486 start_codon:yes stop_codon:yes gene_type:complete